MSVQENRLGGKTDWKTVDSIHSLCWFELLVIRHADMDPNPNLCKTCMTPASPWLKLNKMTSDRGTVNATLTKIWPQPSLQPIHMHVMPQNFPLRSPTAKERESHHECGQSVIWFISWFINLVVFYLSAQTIPNPSTPCQTNSNSTQKPVLLSRPC